MTSKLNVIAREPVLIAALASVVTWLLAKYGINLSPQQASEISGVVLAVTVGFARQAVTPTAKAPPQVEQVPPVTAKV